MNNLFMPKNSRNVGKFIEIQWTCDRDLAIFLISVFCTENFMLQIFNPFYNLQIKKSNKRIVINLGEKNPYPYLFKYVNFDLTSLFDRPMSDKFLVKRWEWHHLSILAFITWILIALCLFNSPQNDWYGFQYNRFSLLQRFC